MKAAKGSNSSIFHGIFVKEELFLFENILSLMKLMQSTACYKRHWPLAAWRIITDTWNKENDFLTTTSNEPRLKEINSLVKRP